MGALLKVATSATVVIFVELLRIVLPTDLKSVAKHLNAKVVPAIASATDSLGPTKVLNRNKSRQRHSPLM